MEVIMINIIIKSIILRITRIMITSNNREYHSFLQLTHKLPDNQK